MECSTVISIDYSTLVHSGEEAMWVRVVGTLLYFSIAHHEAPISGEIHFNTFWTITVKDMSIIGPARMSRCRQCCAIVIEFHREHVCASDTIKTVANK